MYACDVYTDPYRALRETAQTAFARLSDGAVAVASDKILFNGLYMLRTPPSAPTRTQFEHSELRRYLDDLNAQLRILMLRSDGCAPKHITPVAFVVYAFGAVHLGRIFVPRSMREILRVLHLPRKLKSAYLHRNVLVVHAMAEHQRIAPMLCTKVDARL